MLIECKCIKCGTIFKVPPSTFKKGTVKYCSGRCHYAAMKGVHIENKGTFKKGNKLSEVTKKRISHTMQEKKLGFLKKPSNQIGDNHYLWKGDAVGNTALHDWVKLHKAKLDSCELCGEKTVVDCANISGQYYRDIEDYIWLCKKCHAKYDRQGYKTERGRTYERRQTRTKNSNE